MADGFGGCTDGPAHLDEQGIPFDMDTPETFSINDWVRLLNLLEIHRGFVNVAVIGPDPELVRVANFVLTILFLKDPNKRMLFETIRVVAPPTWPVEFDIARVVLSELLAMGHTEEEALSHAARVQQYVAPTLCSEELTKHLRESSTVDIMYVAAAADFRYPSSMELPNTNWVAHSLRLVYELIGYARSTGCAIVIDAGRYSDVNEEMRADLEQVPCNIVAVRQRGPLPAKMLQVARSATNKNWRSVLGQIEPFLKSCTVDFAALVRSVVFHHGEQNALAWKVLEPFVAQLVEQSTDSNSPRIFIAKVSAKAGEWDVAQRLLADFDVKAADLESLEEALFVATACDAVVAASTIVARLRQICPASIALGRCLIEQALRERNFEQLGLHAQDSTLMIPEQQRLLCADLSIALTSIVADYNESAESLIEKYPERADVIAFIFAREAESNEAHMSALRLALLVDAKSGDGVRATLLAVRAFSACLRFRDEKGNCPINDEILAVLVGELAERVAAHPCHPRLRHEFAAALSPETLGIRGIVVATYLILGQLEERQILKEPTAGEPATESDTKALEALFKEMLPHLNVVVIGTGELPGRVSEVLAKRICLVLERELDRLCAQAVNAQTIRVLQLFLYVAVLVCQRAGDEALAANLVRIAAGHLATTGHFQEARDLAEHFLALPHGSHKAMRIAWMCYADIYYRLHNRHDALCGMLFATCFRSDAADIKEAWQEVDLVVRLLRSLGLFNQARELLTKASERFGVKSEQHQLSIDYLKLTLLPRDAESLAELIPKAVAVVTEAIRLRAAVPPTIYLVQLVNDAIRLGIPISSQTRALLELARSEVPVAFQYLVDAHANLYPTLKDIETTLTGARATRYADDLAYDLKGASALAKRALVKVADVGHDDLVALIELLADRGMVELQSRAPIDKPRNKHVIDYLTSSGHQVHMLGVNTDTVLVRVTATATDYQVVVEPSEVFSWERFQQWSDEFPKKYSTMDGASDHQNDSVRASVLQIGIGSSSSKPMAIVADVELQLFPINLLQCEGDFLGNKQPVTLIPSLDWLAERITKPRLRNGRVVAWIPDSQSSPTDGNSILAIIADEWESRLSTKVLFFRDASPPKDLQDADVAIIAAHGGLIDDQYFHVVSDDNHQRWEPKHICAAIGSAGVAVVFVCSGGRLDRSPDARTSIGFVHQLLAEGCQSVVACPWPLAAMVARRWLPVFLGLLKSGLQVSEAAFAANQKMAEQLSGNPPLVLAMHVFGDPTYRLATTE